MYYIVSCRVMCIVSRPRDGPAARFNYSASILLLTDSWPFATGCFVRGCYSARFFVVNHLTNLTNRWQDSFSLSQFSSRSIRTDKLFTEYGIHKSKLHMIKARSRRSTQAHSIQQRKKKRKNYFLLSRLYIQRRSKLPFWVIFSRWVRQTGS